MQIVLCSEKNISVNMKMGINYYEEGYQNKELYYSNNCLINVIRSYNTSVNFATMLKNFLGHMITLPKIPILCFFHPEFWAAFFLIVLNPLDQISTIKVVHKHY